MIRLCMQYGLGVTVGRHIWAPRHFLNSPPPPPLARKQAAGCAFRGMRRAASERKPAHARSSLAHTHVGCLHHRGHTGSHGEAWISCGRWRAAGVPIIRGRLAPIALAPRRRRRTRRAAPLLTALPPSIHTTRIIDRTCTHKHHFLQPSRGPHLPRRRCKKCASFF